jgi:hypothetical protein
MKLENHRKKNYGLKILRNVFYKNTAGGLLSYRNGQATLSFIIVSNDF